MMLTLLDTHEYRLQVNRPIAVQRYRDGINYQPGATMLMSVKVPDVQTGDWIEVDAQITANAHTVGYQCVFGGGIQMQPLAVLQSGDPTIWTWPINVAEDVHPVTRPYYVWRSFDVFRPTHDLGDCRVYTMHYAGSAAQVGPKDALQSMVGPNGGTGRLTVKHWRK